MPMGLHYFSVRKKRVGKKMFTIPKSEWKGKGVYYHRGKSDWTKYSAAKDMARGNKVGTGNFKHTHDKERKVKKVKRKKR